MPRITSYNTWFKNYLIPRWGFLADEDDAATFAAVSGLFIGRIYRLHDKKESE